MLGKINVRRLAEKFIRDFIATFLGSSALVAVVGGGEFDPKVIAIAAGASASIAASRVLRDLGVPGFTASQP